MKKICCMMLCLLLALTGCAEAGKTTTQGANSVNQVLQEQIAGSTEAASTQPETEPQTLAPATVPETTDTPADVDLTVLSSTMVYSEVYNMMVAPEDYVGKVVKMTGSYYPYTSQDGSQFYPACVIQDATACCAQGLEFVLTGAAYPDGYPKMGTVITVIGTFETYLENGGMYCHLVDARLL